MKTVWKYVLDPKNLIIAMPRGAEILSVHSQGDDTCLWVLVDSEAPLEARAFRIYGTGHEVDTPEALKFLGSVYIYQAILVFHVFEVIPK